MRLFSFQAVGEGLGRAWSLMDQIAGVTYFKPLALTFVIVALTAVLFRVVKGLFG
jgi:hypothetical protein